MVGDKSEEFSCLFEIENEIPTDYTEEKCVTNWKNGNTQGSVWRRKVTGTRRTLYVLFDEISRWIEDAMNYLILVWIEMRGISRADGTEFIMQNAFSFKARLSQGFVPWFDVTVDL